MGVGRVDLVAHDGGDLLVSSQAGAERRRLGRAQGLHRGRGKQLAVLAEQGRVDGDVGRVGARAEVDERVLQGVGRVDGDGAAAEGLEVVDQGRIGSAPVNRANSDIIAGKLIQDSGALGLVAREDCLVNARREGIGRVAGLGSRDDVLVGGRGLLQREHANIAAEAGDEGVGARLVRIVQSALLRVVRSVREEGVVVGGNIVGD